LCLKHYSAFTTMENALSCMYQSAQIFRFQA
jgi:hypothetical protein